MDVNFSKGYIWLGPAVAESVRPGLYPRQVHVRLAVNGDCGIGTGFAASSSIWPCQDHFTSAPYSSFIHPLPRLYDLSNWQ